MKDYPLVLPGLTIGLLGGSFDPPHQGHIHISKTAIKIFNLSKLWWLVSPRNPIKDKAPSNINTFTKHGWPGGSGTFVWSNNDQVINIAGGDYCGHVQVSSTQNERLFIEFD